MGTRPEKLDTGIKLPLPPPLPPSPSPPIAERKAAEGSRTFAEIDKGEGYKSAVGVNVGVQSGVTLNILPKSLPLCSVKRTPHLNVGSHPQETTADYGHNTMVGKAGA
ncbi:hypothetical protein PGQ11_006004 [Apiospora arundinis]|uniref:Uncharacterized protein n=1 Tax=Apiospora arundinis TaxID=335852 RepID=A0ABR2IRE1_9PEZI